MIKITIGTIEIEFKNYDDFKKFVNEFEHLIKAKEPVYIPQPYPVYPIERPWITWRWGTGSAEPLEVYPTKTTSTTYIMPDDVQVSYTQ